MPLRHLAVEADHQIASGGLVGARQRSQHGRNPGGHERAGQAQRALASIVVGRVGFVDDDEAGRGSVRARCRCPATAPEWRWPGSSATITRDSSGIRVIAPRCALRRGRSARPAASAKKRDRVAASARQRRWLADTRPAIARRRRPRCAGEDHGHIGVRPRRHDRGRDIASAPTLGAIVTDRRLRRGSGSASTVPQAPRS